MWRYTVNTVEQEQNVKKIFIVDDNRLLLDMYLVAFESQGFEVTPAFGGIDAVEKLRGGIIPDLILFDIETPILNSFEVLKIMRSENLIPNAKIIVFSTIKREASDEESRSLGVNKYLSKITTTPSQLVQEVRAMLDAVTPPTH